MVYSYEDKLDVIRDRCHHSLDILLVLIDRFKDFRETQKDLNPELIERIDNIFRRLTFFKDYYFLLSKAFNLKTIEERNKLGHDFEAIPQNERNRIDFAKFSRENFDAMDKFFMSFVKVKVQDLMDEMSPGNTYPLDEAKKDLIYMVS